MKRRALLAALGTGFCGIAGCVDTPRGSDDGTTDGGGWTTRPDSTTTATGTRTETATPEPLDIGVDPASSGCPALGDDVSRVVCYDEIDLNETPMFMEPAPRHASLPKAEVEFTLTNGAAQSFTTNFYEWHLWKRVDDEWFRIVPDYWPQPAMIMQPGARHTWTLAVDNTELDGTPLGHVGGTGRIAIAGLGGGTYAFTTSGWFEHTNYQNQTSFGATFELEGDPIDLTPTDEVTETIRDGNTVTVHTNVTKRNEDYRPVALTVTRLDGYEGETRRRITEQVVRDRALRNTLPFFEEGVTTVRLEELHANGGPYGVYEPYVLEYDGWCYRVESKELETETETTDA